jgi:PEP-CTERM motif
MSLTRLVSAKSLLMLTGTAALLCWSGLASADPAFTASPGDPGFSVTITVDENGHGTLTNTAGFSGALASGLLPDPGPGGLPSVLTYSLLSPPGLVAGDVLFDGPGTLEPGFFGGGDVVRFNSGETCPDGTTGCLVFYSDNADGFDSLADTSAPPGALYTNVAHVAELGTEGVNLAIYTPTAGEPGFVAGADGPVTYVLYSDIPEPGTLSLFGFGLAALGLFRRRKAA